MIVTGVNSEKLKNLYRLKNAIAELKTWGGLFSTATVKEFLEAERQADEAIKSLIE